MGPRRGHRLGQSPVRRQDAKGQVMPSTGGAEAASGPWSGAGREHLHCNSAVLNYMYTEALLQASKNELVLVFILFK